nr:hypothetical protein [Tanacetum cinerariifolium]
MQTQTSNTLHNAIMEAGCKDRPPMLALGIDNDIYLIVDACPNACEMWKAIERFYKMMNELIRNQCNVTNHQVNVQFLLQLQPEWQREKMLLYKQEEAGIQLNAEQFDWRDDTDDDSDWRDDTDNESDDQELEAHYMYMAKLQPVSPDDVDSRPIFDKEPEQKIDQNDEDVDLAKERELLASLIAKLKCEIDETKNRNTLLETTNKVLVEKLKSEIADFKNKN